MTHSLIRCPRVLTLACYCLIAFPLVFVVGCGCERRDETIAPAPDQTPPTKTAASQKAGSVEAKVRVVDLEGKPLAGMLPIATLQPNAFDKPAATGKPTDREGRGSLVIPIDKWLYLRAWDPSTDYFTNNVREVPPGKGVIAGELTFVMAQAGRLRVRLLTPSGAPVNKENVGLMMLHPTKGPWWPADGDTDADGVVVFPKIPPGQFQVKLKTAASGMLELPEVRIPPGGSVDLGNLQLQ